MFYRDFVNIKIVVPLAREFIIALIKTQKTKASKIMSNNININRNGL